MHLCLAHNSAVALREMTAAQLLHLGTRQVAYLKEGTLDGEPAFLIYGADGATIEVVDAIETAIEVVAESGLTFVTVH